MLRPVETPTREIKNSTACGHSVWIAKTVELISIGGKARYKKAGQLLCRAVLTISSPMQIFVIMWATSGISAKFLYTERLGGPAYCTAFRCGHSLRQSVGK